MTLYVPPSDQPSGVDVKTNTTNEAVTSGEFWKVTAKVFHGGSFYINDEVALDSVGVASFSSATVTSSQNILSASSYTRHFAIGWSTGAGSTIVMRFPSGTTYYTIASASTTGQFNGILAAGIEVYYSHSNTSNIVASATPIGGSENTVGEFIVPAGTNLKVAGSAYYTVIKYKNIGT